MLFIIEQRYFAFFIEIKHLLIFQLRDLNKLLMNFNLNFQTAMVFSTGLFSFFILSFELTSLAGKSLYLIWVCCLFLSFSGNFSLLPTATAKAFGKTHYGVNYGMVFTASVSYTVEFTN